MYLSIFFLRWRHQSMIVFIHVLTRITIYCIIQEILRNMKSTIWLNNAWYAYFLIFTDILFILYIHDGPWQGQNNYSSKKYLYVKLITMYTVHNNNHFIDEINLSSCINCAVFKLSSYAFWYIINIFYLFFKDYERGVLEKKTSIEQFVQIHVEKRRLMPNQEIHKWKCV
jgi:hypothetical protein